MEWNSRGEGDILRKKLASANQNQGCVLLSAPEPTHPGSGLSPFGQAYFDTFISYAQDHPAMPRQGGLGFGEKSKRLNGVDERGMGCYTVTVS